MVREYNEYDEPKDKEAKKILEKSAKKEVKTPEPILHIVEELPTQQVNQLEEKGQVHNFITYKDVVTILWNERNKKIKKE